MTSTCGGLEGDSFGYINVQAIDSGAYEDFGGENQWIISPLIYSYTIESLKANHVVLQRTLRMADANGVPADFHLTRSISLLSRHQAGEIFGDAVAHVLNMSEVSNVGYCTVDTVRTHERTHVASRRRGMFNASPHSVVIVSEPPSSFMPEPFVVDVDYLDGAPHGRIRHLGKTLLIRADGQGKCQVTMPLASAPSILGAIELRSGTLTLWMFDVPDEFKENDLIRIYNPGQPLSKALDWAVYYEMNCFSTTRALQPEHTLASRFWTCHLNADNTILTEVIREIFDVSLDELFRKMLLYGSG